MAPTQIDLTDSERSMLRAGVIEWGGPARVTNELAIAMGFAGRDDLHAQRSRLLAALKSSEPLEPFDWARVLVLTEFVFASDVFGSGRDWSITTGIQDVEAIEILRSLQGKFGKVGSGRKQFGPTRLQEFQWHDGAATAIRVYKHGRSDLAELVDAIEITLSSFGEDLSDLRGFLTKLKPLLSISEADQRSAVMAEVDNLQNARADHLGKLGRRAFWI